MVIFVPDVWHLLPTRAEYEGLRARYKQRLEERLLLDRQRLSKSSSAGGGDGGGDTQALKLVFSQTDI